MTFLSVKKWRTAGYNRLLRLGTFTDLNPGSRLHTGSSCGVRRYQHLPASPAASWAHRIIRDAFSKQTDAGLYNAQRINPFYVSHRGYTRFPTTPWPRGTCWADFIVLPWHHDTIACYLCSSVAACQQLFTIVRNDSIQENAGVHSRFIIWEVCFEDIVSGVQ